MMAENPVGILKTVELTINKNQEQKMVTALYRTWCQISNPEANKKSRMHIRKTNIVSWFILFAKEPVQKRHECCQSSQVMPEANISAFQRTHLPCRKRSLDPVVLSTCGLASIKHLFAFSGCLGWRQFLQQCLGQDGHLTCTMACPERPYQWLSATFNTWFFF